MTQTTNQEEIMDEKLKAQIQEILEGIKEANFKRGVNVTNEQALGLLVSKFLGWDGVAILETSFEALQDANFHTEAGQVQDMLKEYDEVEAQ